MEKAVITETDRSGVYRLKGTLTIAQAGEILGWFINSLELTDRLTVLVDEEAEVDLSFLQILCSACRTAAQARKVLDVRICGAGNCLRVGAQAGYRRERGCRMDAEGACFWTPEGLCKTLP